MPARLSININKVATLRNSRGGNVPDVLEAISVALKAGATGITLHPRGDERHITAADVLSVSAFLESRRGQVELNVEGDPRPDLMDVVCRIRPDQCTLVPVRPGERTSEAGWNPASDHGELAPVVARLKEAKVRVSLFVDPQPDAIRWASRLGADRVELYTEPYARAFAQGRGQESFQRYAAAAALSNSLGLGVNAGHDLDLENLPLFRTLPHLDEVSIGHALISRALFHGLEHVVREYLDCLAA